MKQLKDLSYAEVAQLNAYLSWAEGDGHYYGNEDQFRKRHRSLRTWIEAELERRRSGDSQSNG
jgi:hypothetical protein